MGRKVVVGVARRHLELVVLSCVQFFVSLLLIWPLNLSTKLTSSSPIAKIWLQLNMRPEDQRNLEMEKT